MEVSYHLILAMENARASELDHNVVPEFHMGNGSNKQRSGQIPAFGNWDYVNQLPITQYFQNARQAGLTNRSHELKSGAQQSKLYNVVGLKNSPPGYHSYEKEHKKQAGKTSNAREHQNFYTSQEQHMHTQNKISYVSQQKHPKFKPMDEDLYKIPAEMLQSTKRKKYLGFFSRCFVPRSTI